MLDLISTPWKIATGAAVAATLGLAVTLAVVKIDNHQLANLNEKLDARINDPSTGYVARLAQANTNVETLKVQLAEQNEAFQKKSDADAAKLRDTEAKLAVALAERAKIQKQVDAFLAIKPRGNNLEERVIDVDSRLLEMLK